MVFLFTTAGLLGSLVLLDPYDTGRFALFSSVGVPKTDSRTANASRGRDNNFNWAIIGNSRTQLLSPQRLNAATGQNFVSLAIPGTWPKEQLMVARWVARHHARGLGGFLIGLDAKWCRKNALLLSQNPFPDWLYSEDWHDYLLGLVRWKTLEMGISKLSLLAGIGQPARPDGYDNYESDRTWIQEEVHQRILETASREAAIDGKDDHAPGPFPAAEALDNFIGALPTSTLVILVFNPAFSTALPPNGSAWALSLNACKQRFTEISSQRPNTALLDFFEDNALAREESNFWDAIHYRTNVAEVIERRIADEIRAVGTLKGAAP